MKWSRRLFPCALFLFPLALWAATPADGTWDCLFETEVGPRRGLLAIEVQGEQVTGKLTAVESQRSVEVKGVFKENILRLQFPFYSVDAGYQADLIIEGTIEGDSMQGSWRFDQYTGPFKATRVK